MITGKFVPKTLFVLGSILLGPNEPKQPPITFAQITKYLLVSIDLFGPTVYDHHPSFLVSGFFLKQIDHQLKHEKLKSHYLFFH